MPEKPLKFPGWLIAVVLVGGALMILGGVVALMNPSMMVAKGDVINGAVRTYAGYLVSRNLAIGAMLIGALFLRARSALGTLLLLAGVIQLVDAGLDCMERRWMLVPGVTVLGIAFLLSARKVRP